MSRKTNSKPVELALVGEVDDWEKDVLEELLDVEPGGACTFYFDCSGGTVSSALAVLAFIRHRPVRARAVVLGDCSSSAIMLFAACKPRLVTRYSTFLFHRMRWESDEDVNPTEALNWAKHFARLEHDLDELIFRLFGSAEEQLRAWTREGAFVTGEEIAAAGLAELLEIG
jgi:ATP-dependent protease ClpP protease subunit